MTNKILSLLIIFIGLPSFIFSGSTDSSSKPQGFISNITLTPEEELAKLRHDNSRKVEYIREKFAPHENIDSLYKDVLSKID